MSLGTPTLIADGNADAQGPIFHNNLTFLGDDAYTTGGTLLFDQFVQELLGDQRKVVMVVGDDGPNEYRYVVATNALKAFVRSTGVEVAGAVDLSSNTVLLTVVSK